MPGLSQRASGWITGCLLLTVLLGLPGVASSQDENPAEPTPPEDRTIFVPFDELGPAIQQPGGSAIVPYAEYLKFLAEKLATAVAQVPVSAVVTQADYVAVVEDDIARVTATLTVQVLGDPWVEIPLAFGDAAVGKVTSASEQVLLRGTGDGTYSLLLGEKGEHQIVLELLTKVRTSPEGREIGLLIPPTGITSFELTVPEADQTVEVTPRLLQLPVAGEAAAGSTKVKASLGSTSNITARWHPQASLQPEMDLLVSVNNRQLVTIDGGLVHHDAWLTYDVLRGGLSQLEFAVPLSHRVLDVTADARVKSWQAREEANRQVVTVELVSAVDKQVTVEVHTESAQADMTAGLVGIGEDGTVSGVHAIGAVRESGQVAVRVGEDLELNVTSQQGLTRIAAELVDPNLQPGAATAFRFYAPEFNLGVAVQPIVPRVLVTQQTDLVFDEDELRLQAMLTYQVERAGVFALRLEVPEGIIIDDVQSPLMQDETFDAASRVLTVRLQQKSQGGIQLQVNGHRELVAGAAEASQDLPVLLPLDVARETGTVFVYAPPGVDVITNEADLQSVQPAVAPQGAAQGEALLSSAWSYTRRPLRIPVTTKQKPTRLSAAVATLIDVQPETTEVTTQIDYRVEFAGVDTFQILVPEALSDSVQIEAESTGPESAEIKQKTPGTAANGWVPWTIVLQRDVVGTQRINVTYRLTREGAAVNEAAPVAAAEDDAAASDDADATPAANAVAIQLLRVLGRPVVADKPEVALTSLEGEVRVELERSLSVSAEATGGDVEPIDIRELTLVPQAGALAFRYYSQPEDAAIVVSLTRERHEIQEVVPTLVERGLVEIAVGRDANATFRCQYRVKSVDRQRLRIDLPKDLQLLGVFVDGSEESLNPIADATAAEGVTAYEVNISRRGRSDESFILTVQFNWIVNPPPFESMFGRGTILFPLPRIGGTSASAPLQELEVVIYVPEGFWLARTPERFTIRGERDWSEVIWGRPEVRSSEKIEPLSADRLVPLDFPTKGLTPTHYLNLGGSPEIEVIWWDVVKMSIVFSVALALMAFILLRTSWENKLGSLLVIALIAVLFGVKDRDALAHGLAAARYGLAFLVLLWIVHAIFSRRQNGAAAENGNTPPPATPPASPPPVPAGTA
jgi:hypothetical protein